MQPDPVPLPRRLADPRPVVVVGTLAWLVAALALFVADAPSSWLWTCVVGAGLGLVGLTVIALQSSAARRGSRTAQRGLA